MIDTTLINKLTELANKEKKLKEYKRRLRVKGKVTAKGITKKGNIALNIKKDENEYKFTVLKSHKDRFSLAEKLKINNGMSVKLFPSYEVLGNFVPKSKISISQ